MLERRREEIINMILEEAMVMAEYIDSSEVYDAAYRGINKIRETYSLDELESLYIETFDALSTLKLNYSKKKYYKKIEELVDVLREYPNIDIDKLEEYNYFANVAIDECYAEKDLLGIYLEYKAKLETLKVTNIHEYYMELIDDYASKFDMNIAGVVLSINIAKNAIMNTNDISVMNKIFEDFKSTIGVEYITIEQVREYYKKKLLDRAKLLMTTKNAQSIMIIVDETFKIIDAFNDPNELEVLDGQVLMLLTEYSDVDTIKGIEKKVIF